MKEIAEGNKIAGQRFVRIFVEQLQLISPVRIRRFHRVASIRKILLFEKNKAVCTSESLLYPLR